MIPFGYISDSTPLDSVGIMGNAVIGIAQDNELIYSRNLRGFRESA